LDTAELLSLAPVIGGLIMAVMNLHRAANASNRIRSTLSELEKLRSEAEGLENTLRVLRGHYKIYNCQDMIG